MGEKGREGGGREEGRKGGWRDGWRGREKERICIENMSGEVFIDY